MADLTTLAKAKEWLGIPVSQTTDDALLARLVTAASEYIQKWLSRSLASQSYTEKRNGNGKTMMMLRNYPIVSVASVSINSVAISPASGPTSSGYQFDQDTIWLNGYDFGKTPLGVTVQYTAGYAATPPEVEQACLELIGLRYREKDRIGHVSKSLAGETVSFSQKDMSDSIRTILQAYKRPFMPI